LIGGARVITQTVMTAHNDSAPSQTATAQSAAPPSGAPIAEERAFGTEVQQLLHLMIHSLYSKKEIFLRELVSNASDAIDTLRFLALTRPELRAAQGSQEPAIDITVDKDNKLLRIADTGVGMTREQVIENIGTIARSGTGTLIKKLKEQPGDAAKNLDVIGQFGVGFYSAFMVAKKVELETLSAEPGATPVHFSSEGGGRYTLEQGSRTTVGTTVTLHLQSEDEEYLQDWRLESIVKQYSNYVKWPVRVAGKQANRSTALWARRPSEVTEDEYKDFYKELCGGFAEDEPLARLHLSLDAPYQFQAIVYIPSKPPFDLMMDRDKRRGMQLYVRRVFILDHAEELLPPWLRFVRGVVDSDDLPLNVSREILQKNQVISAIQKQLTKKILEELKRVKEQKPEAYRAFWDEFGSILKEGLFLDSANREKIAEVALWSSLNTPADQRISLADYIAKMPEGQDEVYYITGPSREVVEASPHMEALRKRKLDVLLLIEPVDEWVAQGLHEFGGKKLRAIHKGDFTPPKLKSEEGDAAADEAKTPPEKEQELGALIAHLRVRFQERVKEVRLSSRLTDSASVLVSDEGDMGPHLEQLLMRAGRKVTVQKPILEVNPKSPLVQALAHLLAVRPGSEELATYSDLLLELAYLAQGTVQQPAQLLSTLGRVLTRDLTAVSGGA
jgi:molecular chaperone HtpG